MKIQVKSAISRFPGDPAPAGFWALRESRGRDAWVPMSELVDIVAQGVGREEAIEFACKAGQRTSYVRRVVASALRRWRGRVDMEVMGGEAAYDLLVAWLDAGCPVGWTDHPEYVSTLKPMVDDRLNGSRDDDASVGTQLAWLAQDSTNALIMDHSLYIPTSSALFAYLNVLRGLVSLAESRDPRAVLAHTELQAAKAAEGAAINRRFDAERTRAPWTPLTQVVVGARAAEAEAKAKATQAWVVYSAAQAASALRQQEIAAQYADVLAVL